MAELTQAQKDALAAQNANKLAKVRANRLAMSNGMVDPTAAMVNPVTGPTGVGRTGASFSLPGALGAAAAEYVPKYLRGVRDIVTTVPRAFEHVGREIYGGATGVPPSNNNFSLLPSLSGKVASAPMPTAAGSELAYATPPQAGMPRSSSDNVSYGVGPNAGDPMQQIARVGQSGGDVRIQGMPQGWIKTTNGGITQADGGFGNYTAREIVKRNGQQPAAGGIRTDGTYKVGNMDVRFPEGTDPAAANRFFNAVGEGGRGATFAERGMTRYAPKAPPSATPTRPIMPDLTGMTARRQKAAIDAYNAQQSAYDNWQSNITTAEGNKLNYDQRGIRDQLAVTNAENANARTATKDSQAVADRGLKMAQDRLKLLTDQQENDFSPMNDPARKAREQEIQAQIQAVDNILNPSNVALPPGIPPKGERVKGKEYDIPGKGKYKWTGTDWEK